MMDGKTVKINRAPVLTLWATVVAERLGFKPEEALTLAKGVAGLDAQSKGQRLGIYEPAEKSEEAKQAAEQEKEKVTYVDLIGRAVPAEETKEGLRALVKGKPVSPASVQRYLETKFGENLADVRAAMQDLAESYDPQELARRAYKLYTEFRPEIPEGTRGWGAQGILNLGKIRSLAGQKQ